jgi:hypothetical protein
MGISVSAQPTNSPPRFAVTITSPDGTAITAAALIRVDPSGAVPTRVQLPVPAATGSVVFDYEAPWDTAVTYSVGITYGAARRPTPRPRRRSRRPIPG